MLRTAPLPPPHSPRRAAFGAATVAALVVYACATTAPSTRKFGAPTSTTSTIPSATSPGLDDPRSVPDGVEGLPPPLTSPTSPTPAGSIASAGPSSAVPARCPPATALAPPNAFADDGIPDAEESPLADLDGDGRPEVQVSYPASFQERGTLVLERLPPPSCFRVLYDGVGASAAPRKTKSLGRIDLSLFLTPITSRGRGSAIGVARFDGQVYRLHHLEGCRGLDGTPIPRRECAELVRSYLTE
jgi:hypothetical protein